MARTETDARWAIKNLAARAAGKKMPWPLDDSDRAYNTAFDVMEKIKEEAQAKGELLRKEQEEKEAIEEAAKAAASALADKCSDILCEIHDMRKTLQEMGDGATEILGDLEASKSECEITDADMEWMRAIVALAIETQDKMDGLQGLIKIVGEEGEDEEESKKIKMKNKPFHDRQAAIKKEVEENGWQAKHGLLNKPEMEWKVKDHEQTVLDCAPEEGEDEDEDEGGDEGELKSEEAKDAKLKRADLKEGGEDEEDPTGNDSDRDFMRDENEPEPDLSAAQKLEYEKTMKEVKAGTVGGGSVMPRNEPSGPPQTLIPRKKTKAP